MNRLPPSLREKQRYLRFKVHAEEPRALGDVVEAVWSSTLDYLGSKDASKADFWIISNKFDEEEQEGIIRVNASMETDFRAALTMVSEIGGEKGFIEIVDVSGTIKSLQDRKQ